MSLKNSSSDEILICASCPQIYQERMNQLCKDLNITKAYARKGDSLDMLSGRNWIPKWESKVLATVVTMAQTINARRVKIICISGGDYCDQEMARQPSLVRAIKHEMTEAGNPSFQVKVEWLEFGHFLEEYQTKSRDSAKSSQEADEETSEFRCPVCEREFTSEQGLSQHMEATGHLWKCHVCEREFETINALKQHSSSTGHKSQAKKSKNNEKPKCKASNSESRDSAKSSQEADEETSEFRCPVCEREFTSEQGLSQHMEATGHLWKCHVCEREFETINALKQHSSSTGHKSQAKKSKNQGTERGTSKSNGQLSNEKPKRFSCRVCNGVFNSKQSLFQHIEATSHQIPPKKPVRGTCYCGASLNSFKAFQDHLRESGAICAKMVSFFHAPDYDVIAKGVVPQGYSTVWEDGPPRYVSADQDSITLEWNPFGSGAGLGGMLQCTYSLFMIAVPDQPLYPIETYLWFENITKGNKLSGCSVRKKNLSPNVNYFFRAICHINDHCSSNLSPVSEPMRVKV